MKGQVCEDLASLRSPHLISCCFPYGPDQQKPEHKGALAVGSGDSGSEIGQGRGEAI